MIARPILVVFPHPDDEVFAMGTIIHYIRQEVPVTYVCATLGGMGRNMGSPTFANRETLPLIRKQELEEACRILGVKDLRRLGLRDKTLEFETKEGLDDRLVDIMVELNPSIVITFYPGYSVHPDHDACGAAVVRAVKRLPKEKRPEIHCTAISKDAEQVLGKPDMINDISDVLDQKIAALSSHRTQVGNGLTGLGLRLKQKDTASIRWLSLERFWRFPLKN